MIKRIALVLLAASTSVGAVENSNTICQGKGEYAENMEYAYQMGYYTAQQKFNAELEGHLQKLCQDNAAVNIGYGILSCKGVSDGSQPYDKK
jgi:hypothetical protein